MHHSSCILVVVDDDGIRGFLTELLTDLDYAVHPAASSAQALAVLQREPIDLIVLDDALPLFNGLTFLAWYRVRAKPAVPIVLLTSKAQAAAPEGISGVVPKPFLVEELETYLHLLLPEELAVSAA